MTALPFVRRFVADYARNRVNLVVLVLVPVVFVLVAAGPMADAAKLLGGTGAAVETATAGWAAGFLAGRHWPHVRGSTTYRGSSRAR